VSYVVVVRKFESHYPKMYDENRIYRHLTLFFDVMITFDHGDGTMHTDDEIILISSTLISSPYMQ
jgi:hypothetical protein